MSARVRQPSAEDQMAFIARLQRLFAEGDFTATYKFALLMALANLAVERGTDDAAPLPLPIRDIAGQFVRLYWRHSSPYSSGRAGATAAMLVQNLGAQAAVLTSIAEFRRAHGVGSLTDAMALRQQFSALVGEVSRVVSAQPINYLQNFGGTTDEFLYVRSARGSITLQPGVAFCLRRYYPLIQSLSRAGWVAHIKGNSRNRPMLGDPDDLEDFLFSTSRQTLAVVGAGLRKIDGPRCFYCGHGMDAIDVDHYVPFSLYPRDLAHNFVLAHPRCNRSKSDALAARAHLEKWIERLISRGAAISELGYSAGVADDVPMTRQVAQWAYGNAVAGHAQAWLAPGRFEPVGEVYLDLLA